MDNKINGRTPEEIKLRLACIFAQDSGWCEDQESCEKCEYNVSSIYTEEEAARDSLILIQQLERERDAAVEDLRQYRQCETCKHYAPDTFCSNCRGRGSAWQWRGAQKEVE